MIGIINNDLQGPCGEGEWLVLNEDGSRVICVDRLCPCDPAAPDLCEVGEA